MPGNRKKFGKYEQFVSVFGEETAQECLSYTLERDEIERRYCVDKLPERNQKELELKKSKTADNEISADFGEYSLAVQFLKNDIVHFTWATKDQKTPPYRKDLVSEIRKREEKTHLTVHEDSIEAKLDEISIRIMHDGSVISSSGRTVLRKDLPPYISAGRIIHETDVRNRTRFFGTGERALPLNLRRQRLSLWNSDIDASYGPGVDPIYINIPFFIDMWSDLGYGILYLNPSRGTIDLCKGKKNRVTVELEAGILEYYVFFGSMEKILEGLAALTGNPMLPPKWTMGLHQSKNTYYTQREIEEIAQGFEERNLPVASIYMDIEYMDGFRVFTANQDNFPDLGGLSSKLRKKGIHLVTILNPGVKWDPNYRIYRELIDNGFFVTDPEGNAVHAPIWPGKAAFPDFTSEMVRKWWSSQYSYFMDKGITGLWHDMLEPTILSVWGHTSLPLCAIHEKGLHKEVHNIYGLYMGEAGYKALITNHERERPYILSRSGWAGIQKYAFVWTGDTESTWEELRQTAKTIQNLSLTGIPFSCVDIGGFSGTPSSELYIRWFQLGSFIPLFRVHSAWWSGEREPWKFGDEILAIARKFIDLRYSLIPYWFSLAYESHQTGHPVIRPLNYAFPDLYEEECFMIGDSLLVCPVMESGVDSKRILLPPGKWHSIFDNREYSGEIEVPITLDTVPVFVREGSIIPRNEKELVFDIYPGADFHFTYYDDDSMLQPKFHRIDFTAKQRNGSMTVSFSQRGNAEILEKIKFRVRDENYAFKENGKKIGEVDSHSRRIELIRN